MGKDIIPLQEVMFKQSHAAPCPQLQAHETREQELLATLKEIKETQHSMKEMLDAWNNTRGFVQTVRSVGGVLLWLVGIAAAFAAFTELARHWLIGK